MSTPASGPGSPLPPQTTHAEVVAHEYVVYSVYGAIWALVLLLAVLANYEELQFSKFLGSLHIDEEGRKEEEGRRPKGSTLRNLVSFHFLAAPFLAARQSEPPRRRYLVLTFGALMSLTFGLDTLFVNKNLGHFEVCAGSCTNFPLAGLYTLAASVPAWLIFQIILSKLFTATESAMDDVPRAFRSWYLGLNDDATGVITKMGADKDVTPEKQFVALQDMRRRSSQQFLIEADADERENIVATGHPFHQHARKMAPPQLQRSNLAGMVEEEEDSIWASPEDLRRMTSLSPDGPLQRFSKAIQAKNRNAVLRSIEASPTYVNQLIQFPEGVHFPLDQCVRLDWLEGAIVLLDAGAEMGFALQHAKSPGMVDFLLKRGAKWAIVSSTFGIPQQMARDGHTSALMHLINHHDFPVNETDRLFVPKGQGRGMSVLHCAVMGGHAGLVQELLDAGAEPNMTNDDGVTPLLMTAGMPYTHDLEFIREELLSEKANIDAADGRSGATMLHEAASRADVATVLWLLSNDANPLVRDMKGRRPFQCIPPAVSSVEREASQLLAEALGESAVDTVAETPEKRQGQGRRASLSSLEGSMHRSARVSALDSKLIEKMRKFSQGRLPALRASRTSRASITTTGSPGNVGEDHDSDVGKPKRMSMPTLGNEKRRESAGPRDLSPQESQGPRRASIDTVIEKLAKRSSSVSPLTGSPNQRMILPPRRESQLQEHRRMTQVVAELEAAVEDTIAGPTLEAICFWRRVFYAATLVAAASGAVLTWYWLPGFRSERRDWLMALATFASLALFVAMPLSSFLFLSVRLLCKRNRG